MQEANGALLKETRFDIIFANVIRSKSDWYRRIAKGQGSTALFDSSVTLGSSMRGYKRIRVFPDRDLRATTLEMAVIDCRVMQRLRDVRQLGQSLVAFPTAEHSRFSHALGALYWSTKMISYIRENYFSKGDQGNENLLKEANNAMRRTVLNGYPSEDEFLCEVPWFEQLVRLAALLHDVTHLPFGHTLEDQAGLLPRHDEDPERIEEIFRRLIEELEDSPHLKVSRGDELRRILFQLLDQCKGLYFVGIKLKERFKKAHATSNSLTEWQGISSKVNEEFFPFLTLVYDIVNNTICADLIDYLQRDTLNCGMPWTLDKSLLSNLKILQQSGLYRLGVAVGRNGKLRHDVVTAVLGLLRARYDITEKVYYHHTKCAADAMLEKAIRSSGMSLHWRTILDDDLGDEGLLNYLKTTFNGNDAASMVLAKLRSRRFHKAVYRLRGSDWSSETQRVVKRCNTPDGRGEIEHRIADRCKIDRCGVIVSCLPRNMQLKEAEALVEWTDGDILHLSELPKKKHYLPEVTNLTERYLDLWSLTVYLDQRYENHAGVVASVSERLFDHKNDPLIADYIKSRYPKAFEIRDYLESIAEESEVATVYNLNVAFGGGSPDREVSIEEVVLDQIESRVAERRGDLRTKAGSGETVRDAKKASRRAKRREADASQGALLESVEGGVDDQSSPERGDPEQK